MSHKNMNLDSASKNESWHFDIYAIGTTEDNFEVGEDFAGDGGNFGVQFIGLSTFIP